MGCLYIAALRIGARCGNHINIGVGLSALLVSTNRAMREPSERGTSGRLAPRFMYKGLNEMFGMSARSRLAEIDDWHGYNDPKRFFGL